MAAIKLKLEKDCLGGVSVSVDTKEPGMHFPRSRLITFQADGWLSRCRDINTNLPFQLIRYRDYIPERSPQVEFEGSAEETLEPESVLELKLKKLKKTVLLGIQVVENSACVSVFNQKRKAISRLLKFNGDGTVHRCTNVNPSLGFELTKTGQIEWDLL